KIERRDYSDRYAISTNSKNQYTKESIVNFKAIYSRRLSASLLAGGDFVYLKNYHRLASETYYATIERSTASDDLLRDYRD
ncbi:MAG: hypothetical protein WBC88_03080, partial [Candidatus Zixiibacteriota bacterium]